MGVVVKRSSMTFFSDGSSHRSHRVRIVLAEKGVTVDILDIDPNNKPEELLEYNPYNTLPTLVDRDLSLYEANVMMEYLDERFPHPPLLPVYPVARAQSRLWMHRIEQDWVAVMDQIQSPATPEEQKAQLRRDFGTSLEAVAPIFIEKPFFMSPEFSLVDCCVAPLLWRLPALGIELDQEKAKPLFKYMDRLFERDAFQASLSEIEREMRG